MTMIFQTLGLLSLIITTTVVCIASSSSSPPPSVYPVDEYIFLSNIDHYSFRPVGTFALRFYVNEQYWNNNNNSDANDETPGPCFFYAGNEANIFQFINNTGFMFEAAQEFNAMVVFAEHRYYGESLIPDDMSFLTVEQAMADFDALSVHIRTKWRMPSTTAFIAFGGSYGANLALWLRLKNSNLWAGAIASSATPLKHVLRETNGFALIETQVYANVSSQCPDLVRMGWKELYQGAASREGRKQVAKALGLCEPSLSRVGDAEYIHGWVSDALETMVQYGYPYPTSFYNPVPAYPFQVACQGILVAASDNATETVGLAALKAAVDVYYNYTGQAGPCYDFGRTVKRGAEMFWRKKGNHDRLHHLDRQNNMNVGMDQKYRFHQRFLLDEDHVSGDENAWGYQTCTEVYQPMPTDGVTDFEVPYTPDKQQYFARCWKRWGVHPRPNWEEMMLMGSNIQGGSNIFLSNGQLDPWRAAGIQKKPKGLPDSIIIRIIENGAHHLDLRAANPADPPSVVAVRQDEKAAMRQWIAQWKETYGPEEEKISSLD